MLKNTNNRNLQFLRNKNKAKSITITKYKKLKFKINDKGKRVHYPKMTLYRFYIYQKDMYQSRLNKRTQSIKHHRNLKVYGNNGRIYKKITLKEKSKK